MAELQCIVVTPEATVLDETASFVVLPLYDGELGVLPSHAPLIGRLGYGEMRITAAGGRVDRYFLDGGFVQVAGDQVSVLTNRATPIASLDAKAAAEQLAAAQSKSADTPQTRAIRDEGVRRARAQLRVAERAR